MKVSNGIDTFEVDDARLSEAEKDGFVPTIKVSNGKATFDVHPNDLQAAEADGYHPAQSELQSGLRGLAQGASFGFADELTGLAESALTDKTYEQARDESRQNYEAAQEQNPKSYMAGELGGAVGTAFIPGLGALNAGKAATFAGRAGLAAAQGGLAGLGLSKENDLEGLAKDTAIGAGAGAVLQGVGEKVISPLLSKGSKLLSSASEKAGDGIDWGLKKVGRVAANIPEADTERYLANKAAVNNSQTIGELGDDLLKSSDSSDSLLSQMYKRAGELSSDAWNTLDKSKYIAKQNIRQAIADAQDELLTDGVLLGKAQGRAHSELQTLMDQIDNLNDQIPEPTMKKILQALDGNIDWNDPSKNILNKSLADVRSFVDSTLKSQNPAYKEKMIATEKVSKAIDVVKKAFENRQSPEDFNKFIGKVKNLGNKDEYSIVNKALNDIKTYTGQDIREDILNSQAKSSFLKDTTNGSRKTLLGTVIGGGVGTAFGGPLGYTIGAGAGASAGGVADKYSGSAVKALLDLRISGQDFANQFANTKFYNILNEAASRGNKSLAATYFLLNQQNQEFRKLNNNKQDK